jgi:hypothetical protein
MTAATIAKATFGNTPFGKANVGNGTRLLPKSQGGETWPIQHRICNHFAVTIHAFYVTQ